MGAKVFNNPKDHEELARIISYVTSETEDPIIIDFFAGSASTAQAAMTVSVLDRRRIKFVCVQLPEKTFELKDGVEKPRKESKTAFDKGYKTIADISKERIRRAGAKIREEHEVKLKAVVKEADLLTPQSSKDSSSTTLDTGFRVFKLASSNFKRWDGEAAAASKEALIQQMEATLDHIAAEATQDSLLFEILLKAGYQLTCPLEKLTLAGHTVWSVDGGSLFVCVEDRIDSALVDAVAEKHPVQFICLDRALQGNDPLKVNTLETFRAAQPEIQFRTV